MRLKAQTRFQIGSTSPRARESKSKSERTLRLISSERADALHLSYSRSSISNFLSQSPSRGALFVHRRATISRDRVRCSLALPRARVHDIDDEYARNAWDSCRGEKATHTRFRISHAGRTPLASPGRFQDRYLEQEREREREREREARRRRPANE